MDFLDDLSPGTKRYAIFALLLCLGVYAFDCVTADGGGKTASDPALRSVTNQ